MWKGNGCIHVYASEIKSSSIDCETSEVLEKCKAAEQLAEINLNEKENLLPIKKVELGFIVHGSLSKLSKWDTITMDETKKIFDRSPFTCDFVRHCTVLNPVVFVSCEQKSCQKHF